MGAKRPGSRGETTRGKWFGDETSCYRLLLLIKQHLTQLVPGWVIQGSCSGAVIGWVLVYYNGGSGVAMGTRDTTSCQLT